MCPRRPRHKWFSSTNYYYTSILSLDEEGKVETNGLVQLTTTIPAYSKGKVFGEVLGCGEVLGLGLCGGGRWAWALRDVGLGHETCAQIYEVSLTDI